MRRKIIKQGAATLTISLPAKWTKKFNLKSGDEIELDEKGPQLLLSQKKEPTRKESILEITDANKHDIQPVLSHLYRMGFDSIVIKNVSPGLANVITNITKDYLLGFEVTERDGKKCKITNISEPTEEKYPVLLRRVFLIIKETQHLMRQSLRNGDYQNFRDAEDLRKQSDKFIFFCLRIVTREKGPLLDWELLKFLLQIEHAYHYMYNYAYANKFKSSQRVNELLDALEKYFQLYYDAFYQKDITAINKITKMKKDYQFGKCYSYLEQAKGSETVILAHIREIFRLIQIGASPILGGLLEAVPE
jgi:phosphate uptake regulator